MTARTTTRVRDAVAHRNRQDGNRELAGQEYLSPAEFAAALSVSIRTVRNWISSGVITATRVGPRLIRIPATELQRAAVPILEPAIATRSLSRAKP